MDKLKQVVLLFDGDIYAYRSASATDGRQYMVKWEHEGVHYNSIHKYKKDADLKAAEVEGTIELSYNPEPEAHALFLLKKAYRATVTELEEFIEGPYESECYLTNKGSFREKLCPSYKQNRIGVRRPANLASCKQWLVNKKGGQCRHGEYEADDMLSIRSRYWAKEGKIPIIISIDKDLNQVPGWHYNFAKRELYFIDEITGLRNFYKQVLTGDSTDGIPGIKGLGPKTAEKIIDHLNTPFQMYCAALKEWLKFLPQEDGEDYDAYLLRVCNTLKMSARMLYLCTVEGEIWEEPHEEEVCLATATV